MEKKHRHGFTGPMSGEVDDAIFCSAEVCECDCYAYVRQVDALYISRRYEGNVRRSVKAMHYHLCALIANDWTMNGSKLVPTNYAIEDEELRIRVHDFKGMNVRSISPYFITHRKPSESSVVINLDIAMYYKAFDIYYMRMITRKDINVKFFQDNVWQAIYERKGGLRQIKGLDGTMGLPWAPTKVDSLLVLCLKTLSVFNKVYGGLSNGTPNLSYSLENFNVKLFPVVEKLKKPTHTMNGVGQFLGAYTSRVLSMIVKLLKVEGFKQSKIWKFENELEKSKNVPLGSSSGLKPGGVKEFVIDGVKYRVTHGGNKYLQMEYAIQEIWKMRNLAVGGEPVVLRDRAWSIVFKNEIIAGMTLAEIYKAANKMRTVNIPGAVLAISQRMVHGFRQNIERGNHIAIGISYWNGGANNIANRMHYNEEGYTYYTGDFSALDTSIKAHLLLIYSVFTRYYYKNEGDYDVFEKFLQMVATNLTFKVVHLYADVWKTIYGGMPSGAYETSHGDSWIVMFTMILFFFHQGNQYPSRMLDINNCLISEQLFFYIYGDDSLWCVPDRLTDIINIYLYADFVEQFFQMTMRDLEETKNFLSVPDHVGGDLQVSNCVFLSKYFVDRDLITTRKDLPKVLPYRHFSKIIKKYAHGDGSSRTTVDYILAAIGMVYDSFGTNPLSYDFCYFMYTRNMAALGVSDFFDLVTRYRDSFTGKSLDNMLKKCGIPLSELKDGFPSKRKLLDMHINDPDKHIMRDERFEASDFVL